MLRDLRAIPPKAHAINAAVWTALGAALLYAAGEQSWLIALGWILIGFGLSSIASAWRASAGKGR